MNTYLIRKTACGEIEGIFEGDCACWLGVPYAAPPLAELRFRAPAPHKPWSGVRKATALAAPSLQKDGDVVIGSEDCLYLNIYRPNTEEKGLPVLFFIHGGNNQTDSGAMMDGEAMACSLNAVVVTINLRLNSLGWLNLPALKTGNPLEDSGNFGLLDILAALDWTSANIAAFGGDPENITASGYSSGARDLLCMLISPAFEGKFKQALTFSGGITTTEPCRGAEIAARAIAPLAVEDGLFSEPAAAENWLLSEGADVREWLYSVSGARFGSLMPAAAIRMSVFPHLFADGALIPASGFDAKNLPLNVPLMCLSGGHEFDFPANNDPLFKTADFTNPEVLREYKFATKYGGYLFGYINAEQNARKFSENPKNPPIFAGRCLWGMSPEVTDEYAAMRMGGTHGLDLYLIMGIEREDYALTENVWRAENRAGRDALRHLYLQYISAFIRSGDPNCEGAPTWSAWSGEGEIMLFDASCDTASALMSKDVIVENDVFAELLADDSLSQERKKFILENVLNGRFFSTNLDKFREKHF